MKEITPYQSPQAAMEELDNGGRFYNLFTKADDGEVSSAELAKAAGVFNDKQTMILFLEMSIQKLKENEKLQVMESLSEDLKIAYNAYIPQHLIPSEAREQGKILSNAIITGVPKQVSSSSDFTGFIMVPIMSGTVMTMVMIPIFEKYEVYKIYDEEKSQDFIIAHSKGIKLPEQKIRCGGVLKSLKKNKQKDQQEQMFLEALYYTSI